MKTAGMSFFVLPHLARQTGAPTPACPHGTFEAYFALNGSSLPAACFHQVGLDPTAHSGGTLGTILAAANATGIHVHLGLAFQDDPDPRSANRTLVSAYAELQWKVAQQLWHIATAARLSDLVDGFYTEQEESNGHQWLAYMETFATDYLQAVASQVKSRLRNDLLIWASPYAVANRTRYAVKEWVLPSMFGALWEQTFAAWAPSLDVVALQDSTGALGNSLADVRELLGNVSLASARQRRSSWTNVELFETWPSTCQWPDRCLGRHPAPFSRIEAQLQNEAPLLVGGASKIIAWEWTSCLSPTPGNGAKFAEANRANYAAYVHYLRGLAETEQHILL